MNNSVQGCPEIGLKIEQIGGDNTLSTLCISQR